MDFENLEKRISKIEERNSRVESDKRWEGSIVRKIAIVALTYFFVCLFLYYIGEENIFVTALVPVFGFLLSTISLRFVRRIFDK